MSRLFDIANVVDSDDWYTPAWIFDGLGLTFDLDVASPDGGAENVPALKWYTVGDDGLGQPGTASSGVTRPTATPRRGAASGPNTPAA